MLKTPQTARHTASTAPRCDRFGNVLDLKVGYARSLVITGEVAEAQRQQRAYAIVHERFARVAVAGEDFLEIALRRTRRNATVLVPIEAGGFASRKMLESHGAVMIPAVGMPGAACTFRLMMIRAASATSSTPGGSAWTPCAVRSMTRTRFGPCFGGPTLRCVASD